MSSGHLKAVVLMVDCNGVLFMKIVLVNAVYGYSSTGRMTMQMECYYRSNGLDTYSFSSVNDNANIIGNKLDHRIHALKSRLFGLQGYYSKSATRCFLAELDIIKPNIVHLHNLHANYINLPLLLGYLAERDIATVLTLHDCWFFTGHCCHYTLDKCDKWKTECYECPILHKYNRSLFFDRSRKIYRDKKRLFNAIPRLAVVGNSEWTTTQARESLLKNAKILTRIYNWIDLTVFYPRDKMIVRDSLGITSDKMVLLGVAQGWSDDKGLSLFINIAKRLDDIVVILVGGISDEDKKRLPNNIKSVGVTASADVLAEYYSTADIFINPSMQETFGNVSAEALACGTPIIVNNATANPELVGEGCGYVVDNNNLEMYIEKINIIRTNGKKEYTANCQNFAKSSFDKERNINAYLELYRDIIG